MDPRRGEVIQQHLEFIVDAIHGAMAAGLEPHNAAFVILEDSCPEARSIRAALEGDVTGPVTRGKFWSANVLRQELEDALVKALAATRPDMLASIKGAPVRPGAIFVLAVDEEGWSPTSIEAERVPEELS